MHNKSSIINKNNVPLLFLISITIFWIYYYSGKHALNGYGQHKQEWWLLLECLVSVPLVCCYCYWHDMKTAVLKSVVYMSLLILLGSYIIPDEQKHWWLYLENTRYVVLAAFILLELSAIITVSLAIKSALSTDEDPDQAIHQPLLKVFGESWATQLLAFEARVWTYVLLHTKIKADKFIGDRHFYCHKKDGTQSNLLGYIMIIAFELPIVHLLLHFIYSPMAANIVSLLTVMSLLWFIAEYRAMALRPVSLTDKHIIVRYGLFNPLVLKRSDVIVIKDNHESISRDANHKMYNHFGVPNLVIELKKSPHRRWHKVYLSLNKPQAFIDSFQAFSKK